MSDTSPDPPSTIGPFVVLRQLGEGAMGVVYAGYDIMLDRKVALKLVRRQLLDNPAIRARMLREAQAMARLSNPHVVQVYQVGEHDESIYVAMEYIDGRTLGAWLKAERRPWQLVLRTVCDAGRGLAAAHSAGLVHRDFKPKHAAPSQTAPLPPFGRILANWGVMRAGLCRVVPLRAAILATAWQRAARLCAAPVVPETRSVSTVVAPGTSPGNVSSSSRSVFPAPTLTSPPPHVRPPPSA